ncbi:MAG TPA: bifunctional diguanylate cyclase/phosphodiesterase [Rhodanobacteraceae bacterium]|nr:bifunctional diguanylate cyclase/phosphodiesterase [Rhodanobacteraceae bacterium]
MPSFALDLTLYTTQAVVALVLAALLLHYHRVFGLVSLLQWSRSFALLAVHLVTAWYGIYWHLDNETAPMAVQLLVAAVSQVAVYGHLGFAALGARTSVHGLRKDDPVPGRVLYGALALGLVCALAWSQTGDAHMQRLFMRVGLRYLLGGTCFIAIAVALWRQPNREGLGVRVAAVAMGLFGLQMLHVWAVYLWELKHASSLPWSAFIGIFSLVTEMFAGFSLLIWLLEDERNRANRTDSALKRLRDFDAITGFPNRRRLLSDLTTLLRQTNQRTALLLLRLDQADTLSGSYGVVVLETVMAETANRLEQHARPGWPRPARLSDTRFVQTLPRVTSNAELTAIANDLLATLRIPFYVAGQELSLSASIGIALAATDSGNAEGLIAAAEAAGQRAHDEGGNRFQYFSSEMNTLALTKLGLLGELRQAFTRGELVLYYQPLVAAGFGNRLSGVEALARWQHPQRGLLLPEMFIEELEQLGMIEEFDRHVLAIACREAQDWQQRYGSEISVSVNISTRSFQNQHFAELVRSLLKECGLAPSRLELEVVESGAMDDPARAIQSLSRLRALGVRVMLDDFGTGYSSLSYLRELPVDGLKIDRSFVDDVIERPRDAAIVAATITLAHSLGLEVVVEGIETEPQLAWFSAQKVDRLQGFLFSPPLDRDALRQRLAGRDATLPRAPDSGPVV